MARSTGRSRNPRTIGVLLGLMLGLSLLVAGPLSAANTVSCNNLSVSTRGDSPLAIALNCSDPNAAITSYAIASPPTNGTVSAPDANGNVTYTPNAGYSGGDSFTYTGTSSDGTSPPATVSITVPPTPNCPAQTYTTGHAGALAITLACDSNVQIASWSVNTAPAHGSATAPDSGGHVSYTPDHGFSGTDTFSYTATSTSGATGTQNVSVHVLAAPVCQAESLTTGHAAPAPLTLRCSDANHPVTAYAISTLPAHGTVATPGGDGSTTYTPAAAYNGPDSFSYTATSADGTSDPATVSVTVNPAPTCSPLSLATQRDTPLTIDLSTACGDASAPIAAYYVNGGPAHGSLTTPDASGHTTYTPVAGYSGPDSFTFSATSIDGTSQPANGALAVQPPNSPPGGPAVYAITNSPTAPIVLIHAATLPPPVLDRSADLEHATGLVLVKVPGSDTFVPLPGVAQVPLGAEINVTHGSVQVLTAAGLGDHTQTGLFYDGTFVVTQTVSNAPFTLLSLQGGQFGTPPVVQESSRLAHIAAVAHIAAKRGAPVRLLWGNAKGNFRTVGHGSSASVRGTKWLVADYRTGTLTYVSRGAVLVVDREEHTRVCVSAHHSYFADYRDNDHDRNRGLRGPTSCKESVTGR